MAEKQDIKIPEEGIHEIPLQASASKARVVSVAAIMLAGLGVGAALLCPAALQSYCDSNLKVSALLNASGTIFVLLTCFKLMGCLGGICAIAGLLSIIRKRMPYRLLRASLVVIYPLLIAYVVLVWDVVFKIMLAEIELGGEEQDIATTLLLWWSLSWPVLAVMLYTAWLHLMLASRSVYAAFIGEEGGVLKGDLVLENIRTHGNDPRARRSFYASVMTHILVIIIIPALMELGGCVEGYKVPKGSGDPVVAMVKMVKPKKKKKKNMILRANSAIIHEIPDLDDTVVDQKMEDLSQVQYKALANAKAGTNMGKGGKGSGGWPEGMEKYKIRFIRLDHGGSGWDDGMDESGADINFLRAFAKNTPFKKIASGGESHSIRLLSKYKSDEFPPFVYMTGDGRMGRVSDSDMEILRNYCLNGGMLIADAGHIDFHRSFMDFMRKVFKDKQPKDIPDDDIIYQQPYGFPEGAPAFWHHGGRRPLGWKHEGRWMVFYHPGDMNDAWKSPDYSNVKPEMRDAAIQLGINIVYYAFNQWDDAVAKAKK